MQLTIPLFHIILIHTISLSGYRNPALSIPEIIIINPAAMNPFF